MKNGKRAAFRSSNKLQEIRRLKLWNENLNYSMSFIKYCQQVSIFVISIHNYSNVWLRQKRSAGANDDAAFRAEKSRITALLALAMTFAGHRHCPDNQ